MNVSELVIKTNIPEQTLRRIPYYHQILAEIEQTGDAYVSSKDLANFFNIEDTQVRKDVSVIGYKGKPKSGYSVTGLKKAIGEFLGINYKNNTILIGAGKLGSALSEYPGLADYGLKLVGVFDNDPKKIGKRLGNCVIQPMESINNLLRYKQVGIAIITVPKAAAQEACNAVIAHGIRAIWNFVPTRLTVPPDIIVRNENMAVGLAILSHYLKSSNPYSSERKK